MKRGDPYKNGINQIRTTILDSKNNVSWPEYIEHHWTLHWNLKSQMCGNDFHHFLSTSLAHFKCSQSNTWIENDLIEIVTSKHRSWIVLKSIYRFYPSTHLFTKIKFKLLSSKRFRCLIFFLEFRSRATFG